MPDSRLTYDSLTGRLMAHRDGVQITVRAASVADLPRELRHAAELEYRPDQRWCWLREPNDRQREMTAAELQAVRAWLERLISGVRAAHQETAHG